MQIHGDERKRYMSETSVTLPALATAMISVEDVVPCSDMPVDSIELEQLCHCLAALQQLIRVRVGPDEARQRNNFHIVPVSLANDALSTGVEMPDKNIVEQLAVQLR